MPLTAVSRAIDVLDALGAAPEGVELRGLAATVGMSPSGAYRTLQTLVAGGLATQDGKRGLYRLGPKVLLLARSMRSEAALLAASVASLHALSRTIGETVALAVLRDRRIWSIASVDGGGEIVARPRLAHGEPYLHNTGRGKLYLAHLPRAEGVAILAETGLPKIGPHTITDVAALWQEVERVRRQGYASNREERSAGLGGVAVPIFDSDGALMATLGITVPIFTLSQDRERELAGHGSAAAREIERRLCGEA